MTFQLGALYFSRRDERPTVHLQFEILGQRADFLDDEAVLRPGETVDALISRGYAEAIGKLETVLEDAKSAAARFEAKSQ